MKRFVIIGGSGLLGGELGRRWRRAGHEVAAPDRQALDLTKDVTAWKPPRGGGTAVICAAIADQEKCRRNPEATRRVNVEKTIKLAKHLVEFDYFVVFLSTNLVFGGAEPDPTPEEQVCPETEYGRQKAATEYGLLPLEEDHAIVRLTKVVHGKLALFTKWREALERGETIRPFSNYVCSPISLDFAVAGISQVAERMAAGIWHFSARGNMAYSEMARTLARRGGYAESLIQPVEAPMGLLEHLPRYASLGGASTEAEMGIRMPETAAALESFEFAGTRHL